MIKVLSTRLLSKKHEKKLNKKKIIVLNYDFINTNSLSFKLNTINKNLIFTSKNAVKSVLKFNEIDKSLPVFCVGEKTKILLQKNNFNVVLCTDYANQLANEIITNYKNKSFTFFCGNLRKETLPKSFNENNITFNEIKVYETILTPQKITEKVNALLFFSPSLVKSYLQMNTISDEICFCIGTTTAQVLENKKIKNIIIAKKPSVENVINKVINYYKN